MGKVALLLEHHFEQDLDALRAACADHGHVLELVSHLWGLDALTFHDLEFRVSARVETEIESIAVTDYAAVIVPDGYAADRLRYQNRFSAVNQAPATRFVRGALHDGVSVACAGFGIWLLTVAPDLLRARTVTTRPEAVADAKNAGARIADGLSRVCRDGNLFTCRGGDDLPAVLAAIAGADLGGAP